MLTCIFRFEVTNPSQTRSLSTNLFTPHRTLFSQVKVVFLSLFQTAHTGIWPGIISSRSRFIVRKADMCDLAIFPITIFSFFFYKSITHSQRVMALFILSNCLLHLSLVGWSPKPWELWSPSWLISHRIRKQPQWEEIGPTAAAIMGYQRFSFLCISFYIPFPAAVFA